MKDKYYAIPLLKLGDFVDLGDLVCLRLYSGEQLLKGYNLTLRGHLPLSAYQSSLV